MIKTFFSEAVETIFEAKYCILFAVLLYCCSTLAGWVYADNFSFLEEHIKRLAAQFAGKDAITFIFKIFIHNLIATYVAMCVVVIFGILPLIIAVFNGLVLGWIIAKTPGMSWANFSIWLIPHGIFEWPAMLLAWGIGIWRGFGYRYAGTAGTWKERWQKANKVFFTVILPLLAIAAIIEGRYHIVKEITNIIAK